MLGGNLSHIDFEERDYQINEKAYRSAETVYDGIAAYEEHHCSLYNCDILDFLATIPDESVGLVIAGPPYGIDFDNGKGWDKRKSDGEWLSWYLSWTRELARITKPGRMIIVWGTFKDSNQFMKYKISVDDDPELSHLLVPENEIIWSYNWGGRSKKNFARKHEYAWCWRKAGADLLFNDDDIRVERKMKKNIRTGKDYDKGTIPTCIWEANNHTGSKDFCGWHPTTKNLDVLTRMILAYSNPGDTVLDPFSGSGSTAIAALRAGRNFEGCELDEEYFEKSAARIEALTGVTVDN